MSVILNDIIYNTNTLFDKGFIHNYIGGLDDVEIIDEPVIIMNSLHSCYSHAIMDSCFSVYFMIQQLLEQNYITNHNVRIFILQYDFIHYPWTNNYVDTNTHTYIGNWQNIIEFLTDKPIIFEHLTKKKYLFKNNFQYPAFGQDKWQRSIWNCIDYYPERNVSKKDVIYSDDYISKILLRFRLHVFDKYNISKNIDKDLINIPKKKELIIIDRKHNKKICSAILDSIIEESQKNIKWNYNGIIILEDMSFSEQIQLFNKTNIFISISH